MARAPNRAYSLDLAEIESTLHLQTNEALEKLCDSIQATLEARRTFDKIIKQFEKVSRNGRLRLLNPNTLTARYTNPIHEVDLRPHLSTIGYSQLLYTTSFSDLRALAKSSYYFQKAVNFFEKQKLHPKYPTIAVRYREKGHTLLAAKFHEECKRESNRIQRPNVLPLESAVQHKQVDSSMRRHQLRVMTARIGKRLDLTPENEIGEQRIDPIGSYNINKYELDQGLREGQQHSNQHAALVSITLNPAAPIADNQLVSYSNRNDEGASISDRSRVPHSPSSPRALFVAEGVLYNIRVYFENSCRTMPLDERGTLINPNGTKLRNDLCNDFDSYCFTATMFLARNSQEEFRHALFKASGLVEEILRAEHPRTLACFLEVFIHLIQTGLPDVVLLLRNFIKEMSAQVTVKGHPWGQICQLLGELESTSLDQAMAQMWQCTIDTFESKLGTLGGFVVAARSDYIKRVYGVTNYGEEERLLRDILAQFKGILSISTPRVMLNLAHNLNKQGRHHEAEEMAQRVLSLLHSHDMYAESNSEQIECQKIISHSHFNRGNVLAAEQTLRQAISMIVAWRGIQHPWVLEFMMVLEGWFRSRGWEDDANTVRRQIGERIETEKA